MGNLINILYNSPKIVPITELNISSVKYNDDKIPHSINLVHKPHIEPLYLLMNYNLDIERMIKCHNYQGYMQLMSIYECSNNSTPPPIIQINDECNNIEQCKKSTGKKTTTMSVDICNSSDSDTYIIMKEIQQKSI